MARRNLLGMTIVVFLATAAWGAKGKEYQFRSTASGGNPQAPLVSDGSGNFYGTTLDGGDQTCGFNGQYYCGTVFRVSVGEYGRWTESTIYEFKNETDGSFPAGSLVFDSAGNLYGVTEQGGTPGYGTVFELSPNQDGSWTKSTLYSFQGGANGFNPDSGVILDATGNLFGTTASGGNCNGLDCGGTVFELVPSSGGRWTENTIYAFVLPQAVPSGLVLDSAGNLYGTTNGGGSGKFGTVFELMPGGDGSWTEGVLYNFADGLDGGVPESGVTFDGDGNLYGEATSGGSFACPANGCGTIFKLTPSSDGGWQFSVAHTFNGLGGSKGWFPVGGLTLDAAGNFYGTTQMGGNLACPLSVGYGCGTIFELTPDAGGATFRIVGTFNGTDGAVPEEGVILDSLGNMYGTTIAGGISNCGGGSGYTTCGVVFMLTP